METDRKEKMILPRQLINYFKARTRTPNYGMREDNMPKGTGYFGALPRIDNPNDVSSELSIGTEIDGKETLIPSMVPTLNRQELDYMLSNPIDFKHPIGQSIMQKAVQHARQRTIQGKPVWWQPNESVTPIPSYMDKLYMINRMKYRNMK